MKYLLVVLLCCFSLSLTSQEVCNIRELNKDIASILPYVKVIINDDSQLSKSSTGTKKKLAGEYADGRPRYDMVCNSPSNIRPCISCRASNLDWPIAGQLPFFFVDFKLKYENAGVSKVAVESIDKIFNKIALASGYKKEKRYNNSGSYRYRKVLKEEPFDSNQAERFPDGDADRYGYEWVVTSDYIMIGVDGDEVVIELQKSRTFLEKGKYQPVLSKKN